MNIYFKGKLLYLLFIFIIMILFVLVVCGNLNSVDDNKKEKIEGSGEIYIVKYVMDKIEIKGIFKWVVVLINEGIEVFFVMGVKFVGVV